MRPISAFATSFGGNSVLVAARSSADGYGKPSYGADVRYDCHIANKVELVRTAEGQVVESKQQIWILSPDVIPTTSRLTLSTGDVGSTEPAALHPKILSVVRRFDAGQPHHSVVYL